MKRTRSMKKARTKDKPALRKARKRVRQESPTLQTFYVVRAESMLEDLDALLQGLSINGFWPPVDMRRMPEESELDEGREGAVFLNSIVDLMLEAMRADGSEEVLTVLVESYHIDPVYRDSYYSILSRSHRDYKRYSYRLVFFKGWIDEGRWIAEFRRSTGTEKLQRLFLGSCVLNPQVSGSVGRTLINPRYLARWANACGEVPSTERCLWVRTSTFKITVRGRPLYVRAFPYRMQDALSMMCTETTLINLVEYYTNEFGEYPALRCSRIHELEAEYTNERTVPARGISYLVASKMLAANGFFPRLFGTDSSSYQNRKFGRALFHYVESGVPVAVNVSANDGAVGHSLLCIGHGGYDTRRWTFAKTHGHTIRPLYPLEKKQWVSGEQGSQEALKRLHEHRSYGINVVMAADLCDTFVVCDDNHVPYQARPVDKLSLHGGMSNSNMLVALHKSMMLDAWDAEEALRGILEDNKTGMHAWLQECLAQSQAQHEGDASLDVVMRVFMASSRRFKQERVERLDDYRSLLYETVPLPHFVWICEFYFKRDFIEAFCAKRENDVNGQPIPQGRAFAEIVIDATLRPANDSDSAVLIGDYPTEVFLRVPWGNEGYVCVPEMFQFDFDSSTSGCGPGLFYGRPTGIPPFKGNLDQLAVDIDGA